jgi:hypothetical protein
MQSDTIEHKVSIFISSKCGDKYTIVRKALKELLQETGMTKVYAFETESGSSQSLPDAYIQYIEESHLCLFLIDNKDGISDAVLAEYQRAKELGKKIICFFCDEDEKKPTQIEEELKATQRGKYCPVHEFADFTKLAYKSVLQDILDIYKKKHNISLLNNNEDVSSSKISIISSSNDIFNKKLFREIGKTQNELLKKITSFSEKESNTSDLDELSSMFLNIILCEKKFDSIEYDKLCEKIIELHQSHYKELISLRLKSLKYYYTDKLEECIGTLREAWNMALEKKEISNWVSNDIAIDLRNIVNISDEVNNHISLKNEGQEYINSNTELVFFPVIDRFENNVYEKIIKQYYRLYTESPYTTTVGGQIEVFKDIALFYYTALIYGSITHLLITRSRIIDALSALCFEYNDHDLFVNLIKMLIIERRDKDLDKLIRIYNQSVDVVNSNDITTIQNCIECIPIEHHKIMSEFLLLKHFGDYFSERQYSELVNKLLSFSFGWIDDQKRIFYFADYIFTAFRENINRIDRDSIVEFIVKVLSMDKNRWYDDALQLSAHIDYSNISPENQMKVLEKSLEIINDEKRRNSLCRLSQHIIRFRKTANDSYQIVRYCYSK